MAYAISAPSGSGIIGINGAAARLVQKGDLIIICSYCQIDASEAEGHQAKVVLLGDNNKIKA